MLASFGNVRPTAAHFPWLVAAALALMALLAAPIPASDYLALQKEIARQRSLEKTRPAVEKTIGLPAPIEGSPTFLVRVIFLMPTDRQPSDSDQYAAKVSAATTKIRCALEAVNAFYVEEQERNGVSTPGKPMNIERELTGEIRVIAVNGTKPTTGAAGYWANTTGLDDNAIYSSALVEMFGSFDGATAACAHNSYFIFPDTLAMDDSSNTPVYRGYLGRGASYGTAGYGGVSMMAYGVTELLLDPAGPTTEDRVAALESSLCSTDTTLTVGSYTGAFPGAPPACAENRNLMRGELVSLYLGVLGHETLHSFRIGHDGYTPSGLMGSGYPRIGATLREIYGMGDCPGVPLLNPPYCTTTLLGAPFSNFIAHNQYFNTAVNPDKTDPTMDIAWPPDGYFFNVPGANEGNPYPIVTNAGAGTGSPLNQALFYDKGSIFADALFGARTHEEGVFHDFFFDRFVGMRVFSTAATDMAGNIREMDTHAFGMIYSASEMGTAWNSTYWARRPAEEDARSRDSGAPLGTFNNPYSDIQTAINAARTAGFGNVLIGEGVWPISTTIRTGRSINISGEGVGRTILDGGGAASSLLLTDLATNTIEECAIANLVFRNASAGVKKTHANPDYNYSLTNCVFYGITGAALQLSNNRGNVDISGLTIANCGSGIVFTNYAPFIPSDRFIFRNNIVSNCTGEGIHLDSIQGLYSSAYAGYNLSSGNGVNFAGNGNGATSYATVRLPGEISSSPNFIAYPPTAPDDLKLQGDSPAARTGHPKNENADGSRRDIGAYLDTSGITPLDGWIMSGN